MSETDVARPMPPALVVQRQFPAILSRETVSFGAGDPFAAFSFSSPMCGHRRTCRATPDQRRRETLPRSVSGPSSSFQYSVFRGMVKP